MKKLQFAHISYRIISVILLAFGVISLFRPAFSGMFLVVSAGLMLLFYGTVKIIAYFSNDIYCLAFQYDLAEGCLLLLLGILTFLFRTKLIPYFDIGLSLLLTVDGLFSFQTAKDIRWFGLSQWPYFLTIACAVTGFSIAYLLCSVSKAESLSIMKGFALIADGLMKYALLHYTVQRTNNAITKDKAESV